MYNYYFNFIIYSIIVIGTTLGKYMTLTEVKEIDIYTLNSNCPDYGIKVNDTCNIFFLCRDNECFSATNIEKIDLGKAEIINKDGKKENIIFNYCNDSNIDHCSTEVCTSDADCLTNRCFNESCMYGSLKPKICWSSFKINDSNPEPIICDEYYYNRPTDDEYKTPYHGGDGNDSNKDDSNGWAVILLCIFGILVLLYLLFLCGITLVYGGKKFHQIVTV